MLRLEDLKRGIKVKGILSNELVTLIDIQWHGSSAVEVVFRNEAGKLDHEIIYRDREPALEILDAGKSWTYDSDPNLFKLVSEANRIHLAHLFDPLLAVHTSNVEPLPHQITAVYGEMLTRQPLRFLLADDPGAGKTIMAGLLIKELLARGDLKRCLVCCPGNLVDQWQDELWQRFQLDFQIISNESIENSKTGNPYIEPNYDLAISRMDHMSRNPDILAKLEQAEWDLVIVDEAHKMSAHFYGQEKKETKRYKLGKLIGAVDHTRHFLLMTATPHNGKEEEYQLFMALLDPDRFEGKFRDGIHYADTSDIMRRMVKEQMVTFDNKSLFPERRAETVAYELSDDEKDLYEKVTAYVREEMNRADRLIAAGEGRRGNRVGFALTTLQRRLASSPEAIYMSICRRKEKLEKRLKEESYRKQERIADDAGPQEFDEEFIDDLDDAPSEEVEELEETVVEQASAAQTIGELKAEIKTLVDLESLALAVKKSGKDKKWDELSNLLQNTPEMTDKEGNRRKLIIFTEHRDTLKYLSEKIVTLLGKRESVVTIHGGLNREDRKRAQENFTQNRDAEILVATDAAGEGINLQRANIVVNYDLPWNPNRLEQRFGRVHRIGQTEICYMWCMVAKETREGEVFIRLLEKLKEERRALGGRVFDVLGKVFEGEPLRKLLIEAIRYGEKPEVREKLKQKVETALDHDHLQSLLDERALTHNVLTPAQVYKIKEDMERAEARKLQPHFIRSFFLAAFKILGGNLNEREPNRYEIRHVPALIRNQERKVGTREIILEKYERVCFEKELIRVENKPFASFICPGHPLLDATILLIKERYQELLKKGTILVDKNDFAETPKALFFLEHSLQDARTDKEGKRRIVSKQMQFVEIDSEHNIKSAGYAPYLDYDPIGESDLALLKPVIEQDWLNQDLEPMALNYAVEKIVPSHLSEVRSRKEALVNKAIEAVKDRLTKEINYWDTRANELKSQELAGRPNAHMNSGIARRRADDLQARLKIRLDDLEKEKLVSPAPPVVIGGALVVPIGLFYKLRGEKIQNQEPGLFAKETKRVEMLAMKKVMEYEAAQGHKPRDVSDQDLGYDIESKISDKGDLLFIEVKGRAQNAQTVTVTKNEILTCLNQKDKFILAIVLVDGDLINQPIFVKSPFEKEPDFAVTSVNYDLKELLLPRESS